MTKQNEKVSFDEQKKPHIYEHITLDKKPYQIRDKKTRPIVLKSEPIKYALSKNKK